MKTKHTLPLVAVLAIFFINVLTVQAAGDITHQAVRLSDTHVMFTTTFRLGALNRATAVPILAYTSTSSPEFLTYNLVDEAGELVNRPSLGIILSNTNLTTVNRGHYLLPYGQGAEFTLLVIAEVPKNDSSYAIQVTNLPYLFEDKNSNVTLTTIPADNLTKFVTPIVK